MLTFGQNGKYMHYVHSTLQYSLSGFIRGDIYLPNQQPQASYLPRA